MSVGDFSHPKYSVSRLDINFDIAFPMTRLQHVLAQCSRRVGLAPRQRSPVGSFRTDPFVKRLAPNKIGDENVMRLSSKNTVSASQQKLLTRAPLGGGAISSPPLVFLRYLLNRCRYHRQTCSTLSPNIFTHCVKILKSRVS